MYIIGKVSLFFLLSWLIGVIVSKTFDLVEGRASNVLFILRGGLILLIGIIVYLYFK